MDFNDDEFDIIDATTPIDEREVKIKYDPNVFFSMMSDRAAYAIIENIQEAVKAEVLQKVSVAVDIQINDIVKSVLGKSFTPKDMFGESVGSVTTLTEILSKKTESFMKELVDGDGRLVIGRSDKKQPRANYLIGEMFKAQFNYSTKMHIEKLVQESKINARKAMVDAVLEQIAKL